MRVPPTMVVSFHTAGPLPSLLRPASAIEVMPSSHSLACRPQWFRSSSLISGSATIKSKAEWNQLLLPRITIATPCVFSFGSFSFAVYSRCHFRRNISSSRASQASDSSASIDANTIQSMEAKIKEQLNADAVTVKDAYGDGRHVSIDVVSAAFEGQSSVNRQRMVYRAIWEELQSTVHAVDHMATKTPQEAAAAAIEDHQ